MHPFFVATKTTATTTMFENSKKMCNLRKSHWLNLVAKIFFLLYLEAKIIIIFFKRVENEGKTSKNAKANGAKFILALFFYFLSIKKHVFLIDFICK